MVSKQRYHVVSLSMYQYVTYIKLQPKGEKTTEVAPENDDRLLLFATLDGSLVNIDRITGNVKWDVKDRK